MMRLYYTPASPYARKVRIVVREKGLEKRIEEIYAHPLENPPELLAVNPLGKVPALVLDDGRALNDSPLICEHLDGIGEGPALFPEGAMRWKVLQYAALADGILDAAVGLVIERRKKEEQRSALWQKRYRDAVARTLQLIDAQCPKDGAMNIAAVTLGTALGYLSFRLPEIDWRHAHPALASWHERFAERPSMRATEPHD